MIRISSLALVLALGGCVSHWHKAAHIPALEQAKYECEYEAKRLLTGVGVTPITIALGTPVEAGAIAAATVLLSLAASELKAQELEALCLRVRGYRDEYPPDFIGFSSAKP
jgi:hypothetical protein